MDHHKKNQAELKMIKNICQISNHATQNQRTSAINYCLMFMLCSKLIRNASKNMEQFILKL